MRVYVEFELRRQKRSRKVQRSLMDEMMACAPEGLISDDPAEEGGGGGPVALPDDVSEVSFPCVAPDHLPDNDTIFETPSYSTCIVC